MSNINELIQKISLSPPTIRLQELIHAHSPQVAVIKGMTGAQDAFVIASCYNAGKTPHIYIANDKESAAYLLNTLQSLIEDSPIYFFPDSFKRPQYFEEVDKENILQRTDTMNKIAIKNINPIVITYPEALFEKAVDPSLLAKETITIKKGELLDINTMIEVLVPYGFERVEFVYQPGQFSIRGGIMDIFSYGNEWPYRLEMFDEEVESIRTFNPLTQLSLQNILQVNIVPNINSKFRQDQKISIFNVLPDNTTIWIQDMDFIIDQLQVCFEKVEKFASKIGQIDDEELQSLFAERAFIYPKDIIFEIKKFLLFAQSNSQHFPSDAEVVTFESSPQPSFNKNFKLLIENLQANVTQGYQNFIFTENTKQIERFYNIFEDIGVKIDFHPLIAAVHTGFIDHQTQVACYTDHQIFERFHRYRLARGFTHEMAINLKMLKELQPGDFVTHIDHGVGKYSGLETIEINGHKQETVRLIYQNNDILYVGINSLHKISRFVGKDGTEPKLNKIGGDTWKALKRKTKSRVKDIAKELIKLYAKRKAAKGYAFPVDGYLQTELEASFIYEDTPDQFTATKDVKNDMEKSYPMDRLICGDVGFGKTEVAVRAAFKAVTAGRQVAILVPTTILALQHYKTFSQRLNEFGPTIDYINRFRTTKDKNEILKDVASGKVDILIGTHAILSDKIKFKDLGLLIIDEEQKFGVASKEKLRKMQVNVDTLTLTATPIPRTMQFSLMAARDLSVIRTPPPNRQPIYTERRVFNDDLVKDAIYYEVNRGGQVFFVHNRVKTLYEVADMVRRMCPTISLAVAHGQMEANQLEKTLVDFIDGHYDVLVSTNIIETGLDIPNANTIIINNAHQFGMSDLHQLRGRVGRSNRKAFCYLFAPPLSVLTPEARKRIKTLEEFSDLGSGFQIAMKDMDIRGAGNLLGAEQSGFISDIGYETYQKILDEAMHELKESDFKELFEEELAARKDFIRDVDIDTDVEMRIPDAYVSNIQERLALYTELNTLNTEQDISAYKERLKDRFGTIPYQVEELFNGLRSKMIAKQIGVERIVLKNNSMNCYFISNPKSYFYETETFQRIMQFVGGKGSLLGFKFKQTNTALVLMKPNVTSLSDGLKWLTQIESETKI